MNGESTEALTLEFERGSVGTFLIGVLRLRVMGAAAAAWAALAFFVAAFFFVFAVVAFFAVLVAVLVAVLAAVFVAAFVPLLAAAAALVVFAAASALATFAAAVFLVAALLAVFFLALVFAALVGVAAGFFFFAAITLSRPVQLADFEPALALRADLALFRVGRRHRAGG